MPWTLAHPAAVLPFVRNDSRWFHVPALVMGSMVPDVGYYIGQLGLASQAHTAAAASASVPVGTASAAGVLARRSRDRAAAFVVRD